MDQFRKPALKPKTVVNTQERVVVAQEPNRSKLPYIIIAVLLVVIVSAIAVVAKKNYMAHSNTLVGVKDDKYQALFLTNGQVYFGKISLAGKNTVKINDIYYLQVAQKVQPEDSKQETQATEPQLIKLGEELHGPEDEMFIERSQVSFWENLKDNSKVVEAIKAYKK